MCLITFGVDKIPKLTPALPVTEKKILSLTVQKI
jgi:hypothetical protein